MFGSRATVQVTALMTMSYLMVEAKIAGTNAAELGELERSNNYYDGRMRQREIC